MMEVKKQKYKITKVGITSWAVNSLDGNFGLWEMALHSSIKGFFMHEIEVGQPVVFLSSDVDSENKVRGFMVSGEVTCYSHDPHSITGFWTKAFKYEVAQET